MNQAGWTDSSAKSTTILFLLHIYGFCKNLQLSVTRIQASCDSTTVSNVHVSQHSRKKREQVIQQRTPLWGTAQEEQHGWHSTSKNVRKRFIMKDTIPSKTPTHILKRNSRRSSKTEWSGALNAADRSSRPSNDTWPWSQLTWIKHLSKMLEMFILVCKSNTVGFSTSDNLIYSGLTSFGTL